MTFLNTNTIYKDHLIPKLASCALILKEVSKIACLLKGLPECTSKCSNKSWCIIMGVWLIRELQIGSLKDIKGIKQPNSIDFNSSGAKSWDNHIAYFRYLTQMPTLGALTA